VGTAIAAAHKSSFSFSVNFSTMKMVFHFAHFPPPEKDPKKQQITGPE
jgi:hypothetical protein